MDVNEELKFLCELKKKIFFWGGGWLGVEFGGQSGCERMNEELKFL